MKLINVLEILTVVPIIIVAATEEEEKKENIDTTNPLLYFRRRIEESDQITTINADQVDDSANLVSFLVDNVKKIFSINEDSTDTNTITSTENPSIVTEQVQIYNEQNKSTKYCEQTKNTKQEVFEEVFITTQIENNNIIKKVQDNSTIIFRQDAVTASHNRPRNNFSMKRNVKSDVLFFGNSDLMQYENLSLTTVNVTDIYSGELYQETEKVELLRLSKDNAIILESLDQENNVNDTAVQTSRSNVSQIAEEDLKLSCIFCNNVDADDCNNPKNRLISSQLCDKQDDLCYSQHTPFGIVTRGCYNIHRNLTTFVCHCNLCNFKALSEMPYIFSRKQDWIENIIEFARTRSLRSSIFKGLRCLACEANVTAKTRDMLDDANCLEGYISQLPTQECEENEICGVKAVRATGYIWRGCVKRPLYNNWWTFCDSDLCNFDSIVSVYDTEE